MDSAPNLVRPQATAIAHERVSQSIPDRPLAGQLARFFNPRPDFGLRERELPGFDPHSQDFLR